MSEEPPPICVTAAVVSNDLAAITHAFEVLSRAALSLAFAGMSIDVYAEPAERDHDDEEITE